MYHVLSLPRWLCPSRQDPRACVTKAQIFTVIYEMDGLHPLPSALPGVRIAWAVCPRHRGRVLPASAAPEFPGTGWSWGAGVFFSFPGDSSTASGKIPSPPHTGPPSLHSTISSGKSSRETTGMESSVLDKTWLPRKLPLREETLVGHLSRPGPSAVKSQPRSTGLRRDHSFSRLSSVPL